jgi:hypothetical protein
MVGRPAFPLRRADDCPLPAERRGQRDRCGSVGDRLWDVLVHSRVHALTVAEQCSGVQHRAYSLAQ